MTTPGDRQIRKRPGSAVWTKVEQVEGRPHLRSLVSTHVFDAHLGKAGQTKKADITNNILREIVYGDTERRLLVWQIW